MMLMIQSAQPRKQRKFRYNAPMHVRQKFVHAHVSKELAGKLGIKRRSLAVREGDTVKIMAGSYRSKSGKVSGVNLKNGKILIEGVARKTAKGKEVLLSISASSVYLTELDLNDQKRKQAVEGLKAKK